MAYQFPTAQLSANGTDYYALGGVTVEFNATVNGVASGVWANLGPITNFQPNITLQNYDHFDGRSGTRTKDMTLVIEKSLNFSFTSEEMNPFVMSSLLLASGYAEATSTTAIVNEAVAINSSGYGKLDHVALASPTPVVTNAAGTTTYVAGTDYNIVTAPDGSSYVQRIGAGAITVGQNLLVDYSYAASNELVLMPLSVNQIDGACRLTFRGANGKNWRYEHGTMTLKPSGNAAINLQEVSTAAFTAEALYDAAATYTVNGTPQSAPFGVLRYNIVL